VISRCARRIVCSEACVRHSARTLTIEQATADEYCRVRMIEPPEDSIYARLSDAWMVTFPEIAIALTWGDAARRAARFITGEVSDGHQVANDRPRARPCYGTITRLLFEKLSGAILWSSAVR
jgi:hypothetical protein